MHFKDAFCHRFALFLANRTGHCLAVGVDRSTVSPASGARLCNRAIPAAHTKKRRRVKRSIFGLIKLINNETDTADKKGKLI